MIKILIVDDEFVIREGLSRGVDWDSAGVTLLPSADSAEAALEIARQTMPDLLITDISMPGKNGIQLIDLLRRQNPKLASIILTGYDEFEYAKRAVDLKVSRYLLKPIAPEMLLQTVNEIRQELEAAQRQSEEYNRLRQRFEENFNSLREFFLASLLQRRYTNSAELERQRSLFRIGEEQTLFGVLFLQFEKQNATGDEQYLHHLGLCSALEQLATNKLEQYPVYIAPGQAAVVLCTSDTDSAAESACLLLERLRINLPDCTVTIGAGNLCQTLSGLPLAFGEAREAASYRFLMGGNTVISIQDVLPAEDDIILYPQQEMDALIDALKNRTPDAFPALIRMLFDALRQSRGITQQYARQLTVEFLSATQRALQQYQLSIDTDTQRDIWNRVFSVRSIDELEDVVQKTYRNIAGQLRQENSGAVIGQVKAYLNANFTQKLNLSDLARRFYLSYSYLSLLFKRETGVNITEYLNHLRISRAKQLLADPGIKVYEIGSMVGIEDSHYFARIFKKQTGVSPSQYREQLHKPTDRKD